MSLKADITPGVRAYVQAKEREKLVDEFLARAEELASKAPDYIRIAKDIDGHLYRSFGIERSSLKAERYAKIKTEKDYEAFLPGVLEQAIERSREIGVPPTYEEMQNCDYVQIVLAAHEGCWYFHGASVHNVPIGSVGRVKSRYGDHVKVEWWKTSFHFQHQEIRPVKIKVVKETVQPGDLEAGDTFIVKLEKSGEADLPKDQVFTVNHIDRDNRIFSTIEDAYLFYEEVSKVEAVRQTSFSEAEEERVKERVKKIVGSVEVAYHLPQYREKRKSFFEAETRLLQEAGMTMHDITRILDDNGLEGVLK